MALEFPPGMGQVFTALSSETRRYILGLLAIDGRSLRELAGALEMTPQGVSHHLGILRESRLVVTCRSGATTFNDIDPRMFEAFVRHLDDMYGKPLRNQGVPHWLWR